MAKGMTCSCGPVNFIWMLIAAIVMAIGIYAGVMALQQQWNGTWPFLNVALWYALAFVILSFAKMAKWKSCEGCKVHGR
jgi:peptidoglycan biosynthesis protein MviN/MurJ (putative lipid II flippase)